MEVLKVTLFKNKTVLDLENIMLSETVQIQKDKYCVIPFI